MKKILIFGIVLLTLVMSVSAASQNSGGTYKMTQKEWSLQLKNYFVNESVNDQLLPNEFLKLEKDMDMIQERTRNLTRLRIYADSEGHAVISGEKEAKLLGIFRMQKTHRYQYNEVNTLELKKNWYDYLWKFSDEQPDGKL